MTFSSSCDSSNASLILSFLGCRNELHFHPLNVDLTIQLPILLCKWSIHFLLMLFVKVYGQQAYDDRDRKFDHQMLVIFGHFLTVCRIITQYRNLFIGFKVYYSVY